MRGICLGHIQMINPPSAWQISLPLFNSELSTIPQTFICTLEIQPQKRLETVKTHFYIVEMFKTVFRQDVEAPAVSARPAKVAAVP